MRLKLPYALLLPLLFMSELHAFTDDSHYSLTFNAVRHFRIFTPPGYSLDDPGLRYPVIYYFHGCGGSYRSSGPYSYADYGLETPVSPDLPGHPDYAYPSNLDFEEVVSQYDLIIVCADGNVPGLPGCGAYFPSLAESWSGNYYNFSAYIRELIQVVEERYHTLKGPENRAVSGLSMGGHTALWLAAANPHLFSSASEFCHSPQFYEVGEPDYRTAIDVQQLWRNLEGLPMRHSTTDGDYLMHYTRELYLGYSGSGFSNEFYQAEWCNHWAARPDLQFAFHMKHFGRNSGMPPCFSHMNLYPSFEIRDYHVSSAKKGNGWIILRDVSRNGMGIYTRQRLPWGKALGNFDIAVSTAPIYQPGERYQISRYDCREDRFTSRITRADSSGRLVLQASGGMGEEIGILGPGLEPPVVILTDTLNETICLDADRASGLSFDVINLGDRDLQVEFRAGTESPSILSIIRGSASISIPAKQRLRMDSMFHCLGTLHPESGNTAYLTVEAYVDGVKLQKQHRWKVEVRNRARFPGGQGIEIFDGRKKELRVFSYAWGKWDDPVASAAVFEGSGNGNGVPEQGETFSVWIEAQRALDERDTGTWHPTVPLNGRLSRDVEVESLENHVFNTGRPLLSAQMRLNRSPEKDRPVRIPLKTEFLRARPLENDCHRNTADQFEFYHLDLLIYEDGTMEIEKLQ